MKTCIYIYIHTLVNMRYSKSKQKVPSLDLPASQPLSLTCMPIFGSRSLGRETSRKPGKFSMFIYFQYSKCSSHFRSAPPCDYGASVSGPFPAGVHMLKHATATCESMFTHSIVSSRLIWVLFQSSSIFINSASS